MKEERPKEEEGSEEPEEHERIDKEKGHEEAEGLEIKMTERKMQENVLTNEAGPSTKSSKKEELFEDKSPKKNKFMEKKLKKEKLQNEQSENKMKKEIRMPKTIGLSRENKMVKSGPAEEETQRATEWSNTKLKDDIHRNDLKWELNNLMNEKSVKKSIKDNLSDKKLLMTTDTLGVGTPRINSTIKKEIRMNTLPDEMKKKIQEV